MRVTRRKRTKPRERASATGVERRLTGRLRRCRLTTRSSVLLQQEEPRRRAAKEQPRRQTPLRIKTVAQPTACRRGGGRFQRFRCLLWPDLFGLTERTSCRRTRQRKTGKCQEGLTKRIPQRLAFRCKTGRGSDADGRGERGRAASLTLIRSDTFIHESIPT